MSDRPSSASHPVVLRWGDEAGLERAATGGAADDVVLHSGPDARWRKLDAPEAFAAWSAAVASRFPDCRSWVTIDDLNRWPVDHYARFGSRPEPAPRAPRTRPRSRSIGGVATGLLLRAFDHQLAGHALAAAALPGEVTVGIGDDDDYELAELLRDVLAAPGAGIPRAEIGPYLVERRAAFVAAHPVRTPRGWLRRRLVASAVPLEKALPRSIAAVYETGLVSRSAG